MHHFFGEVQAVDLAARTLTIKSGGRPLVFHYNRATKISSFHGHISWDRVRPGQGAAVAMRLGEGNIGVAVAVRFQHSAAYENLLSLYRARTLGGEVVSGVALANYIAHEPRSDRGYSRATENFLSATGVFKLGVRRDGTVAAVVPVKSLGNKDRDKYAADWLNEWRFRPNSVTEVQMPVGLVRK